MKLCADETPSPSVEVHVSGDGSHLQVTAVGEMLGRHEPGQEQQTVYGPLLSTLRQPYPCAVSIKASAYPGGMGARS